MLSTTKKFQKKAEHPIDAIERVCDPKYFVFRKDRLPKELIQFTEHKAKRFKRGLYFRPCKNFHDFTYNYDHRVNIRNISDVKTDLVVMRWMTIKEFYGLKIINAKHYGMKHFVNMQRISDLHDLSIDRIHQIIDVCSSGLWSLDYHERFGYAVNQETVLIKQPINVLTHNQWVMHNIGLISKLNGMYYEDSRNKLSRI